MAGDKKPRKTGHKTSHNTGHKGQTGHRKAAKARKR